MKNLKILAFVAFAAAALMALAAGASATVITSPAGTAFTGAVKAESIEPRVYVHYGFTELETCDSEFEWKVESHGAAVTAKGAIASFSLSNCGSEMTLVKPGAFEVHTWGAEGSGHGSVTWTGAEITIRRFSSMHCFYKIENPSWDPEHPYIANITGSKERNSTATLDVEIRWTLVQGSLLCPKQSAWTAYFTVTSPDYLDVD
ncbi:MAG TPA: hypothetical protein VFT79_06970 [Solirubrobacterales bacterium]|nr:hypothetical protein [Solirubrobacterales bacterium]